jgi:hypothetical protein
MDGGVIGLFSLLIILLARPFISTSKPILIDFYLDPTTCRGIAAFVTQVFKNLYERHIFGLKLIGDGLIRLIEVLFNVLKNKVESLVHLCPLFRHQ